MSLTLYGRLGWGSVLIEAQLAFYRRPYTFVEVGDLFAEPKAVEELSPLNPLAQVPTLVFEDGTVLTESAAMTLVLAEQSGQAGLVPDPSAPERIGFLRWLVFITSNIYPTYTYGDYSSRFVSDPRAQRDFGARVEAYAKKLYSILNDAATTPWFLGDRPSALDIYVKTLNHWRPGPAWFRAETPKLAQIAHRVADLETLRPVWDRNFPTSS